MAPDDDPDPTLPVWSDFTCPEYEEALSRCYSSEAAVPTNEIFHGESTRAYGYARRHLLSHQDAEDFMQEYSIRVLQIWTTRSCNANRSIGAYLSGVLKNLLVDWHRKAKTLDRQIVPVAYGAEIPEPSSPEEQPLNMMVDDGFETLLLRLANEESRKIVYLRYVEGHSSQQIADELGLTAKAVDTRMHRAIKEIRRKLNDTSE